jgi:hypothetical protein
VQHGCEVLGNALAKLPMAFVNRVPGPSAHAREELAVHLDQVIGRALVSLGEEAGEQRVAFGGYEALEVVHVVASSELGEMLQELAPYAREVDLRNAQGVQRPRAL